MNGVSIKEVGIGCEPFIPFPLLCFYQPSSFWNAIGVAQTDTFISGLTAFIAPHVFGFGYVGFSRRVFVEVVCK